FCRPGSTSGPKEKAHHEEPALVDYGAVSALLLARFHIIYNPLSNCACRFPAHSLPMIFLTWLATDSARCLAVCTDPFRRAAGSSKISDAPPVDPPADSAKRLGIPAERVSAVAKHHEAQLGPNIGVDGTIT